MTNKGNLLKVFEPIIAVGFINDCLSSIDATMYLEGVDYDTTFEELCYEELDITFKDHTISYTPTEWTGTFYDDIHEALLRFCRILDTLTLDELISKTCDNYFSSEDRESISNFLREHPHTYLEFLKVLVDYSKTKTEECLNHPCTCSKSSITCNKSSITSKSPGLYTITNYEELIENLSTMVYMYGENWSKDDIRKVTNEFFRGIKSIEPNKVDYIFIRDLLLCKIKGSKRGINLSLEKYRDFVLNYEKTCIYHEFNQPISKIDLINLLNNKITLRAKEDSDCYLIGLPSYLNNTYGKEDLFMDARGVHYTANELVGKSLGIIYNKHNTSTTNRAPETLEVQDLMNNIINKIQTQTGRSYEEVVSVIEPLMYYAEHSGKCLLDTNYIITNCIEPLVVALLTDTLANFEVHNIFREWSEGIKPIAHDVDSVISSENLEEITNKPVIISVNMDDKVHTIKHKPLCFGRNNGADYVIDSSIWYSKDELIGKSYKDIFKHTSGDRFICTVDDFEQSLVEASTVSME